MGQVVDKILRCPDCGTFLDAKIYCQGCSRQYEYRDGIYHLLPLKPRVPDLPIYADDNYVKYNALQGETDDYFYENKNPLINWVQGSGYKVIKKLLGDPKGVILECGCGTGVFLDIHGHMDLPNYVMLDIDERSLRKVRDRHLLGGVIQATNYQLPFLDDSFDIVFSHAHLEHLGYLDWGLLEIKRVLKPGGCFIASVPNEGGFLWSKGREFTSARHFGRRLGIDYIKANRIDHFNTVQQIDRALRRYFYVERMVFFPFPWPSFHLNFTSTFLLRPMKDHACSGRESREELSRPRQ